MEGTVFDIQKFCVHDGPGIRTTVFLKGCMMKCKWCHNPESLSRDIQLAYDKSKCIFCQKCREVCNEGVHQFIDGNHLIDHSLCTNCGKCIEVCDVQALKFYGKKMNSTEVIDEVLKDKKYYDTTNGGVTFSGGEPTFQINFLVDLLQKAKENNLNTAIETNGIIKNDSLMKIIDLCDVFLLDYKATDDLYLTLTGQKSDMVLETLETLNKYDKKTILRCPIIQGVNDLDEHFDNINKLKNKFKCIDEVEILPYHSTGKEKWASVGYDYEYINLDSASKENKAYWESKIK